MGLTQRLGVLADVFQPDSSLNVGIGGAANSSYKLTVTGATLTTGAATFSSFVGVNGSPATAFPLEAYINSSTAYSSTSRGNVMRVYNSNTSANIFAGIELGGAGTANDGLAGLNAVVTGSGSADLTFYTRNGGTFGEKVRITSSGNVGIGTNSPNIASFSGTCLTLEAGGSTSTKSAGIELAWAGATRSLWGGYSGGVYIGTWSNENFEIRTNATERMRITSSGDVQISSRSLVVTRNTSNEIGLWVKGIGTYSSGYASIQSFASDVTYDTNLVLQENGGIVGIGNTNPQAKLHIKGDGGSQIAFAIYDGTARRTFFIPSQYYGYMWACEIVSNGGKAWSFGSAGGGGEVGTIVVNASSTAYNTTSDYRLKEDLKDFNGLELLSKIKVYDFKWKKEDARTHGVMAHELQEILPYAVSGEKDAINHEGKIEAQSVDYSKIVPSLVKAIQEQQEIINNLSAKVTALENR